jgi:hypothetical protein
MRLGLNGQTMGSWEPMATRSLSWFPSIKTYTARRRRDSMWFIHHVPLKNRQGYDSHDQCAFAFTWSGSTLENLCMESWNGILSSWNSGCHVWTHPKHSYSVPRISESKHIKRVMAAATSPSGIRNDVLLPDVSGISERSCFFGGVNVG